jgi:hypothetical protein
MSENFLFENIANPEKVEKKFEWREFLEKPEIIPQRLSEQLDSISQVINNDVEGAGEIWDDIKSRQVRDRILLTVVACFRDVISQEDRNELNDLFKEAGEKGIPLGNVKFVPPK